jgi:hypothetical protein
MSGPWDFSLIAVPVEPDTLNAIMHVYGGTYSSITFNAFLRNCYPTRDQQ